MLKHTQAHTAGVSGAWLAPRRSRAPRVALRASSLVVTACSTGILLGTRAALGPSTRRLTPSTYVEVQQATVRNLRPVMGVLLPATVALNALIATQARRRGGQGHQLGRLALLGQLTALGLTAAVELPINAQVLRWDPASPPPDWARQRDRWARTHTLRTAAAVIGLAAQSIEMALKAH